MKKLFHIQTLLLITTLLATSCQEDIIIDTEEGEAKIGIFGGITTDTKQHAITISKTAPFYSTADIEMVSNASVRIVDQTSHDTFLLKEFERGVYLTDPMAGVVGHTYLLDVTVPDNKETLHFSSQSQIDYACPEKIDSIQVHEFTIFEEVNEDIYKICPFFQTAKQNLYYLFDLEINGRMYSDTLHKKARLHLGALSGFYYNGIEMSLIYKDLNIYPSGIFNLDQTIEENVLHVGDTIAITMYSVPKGYYNYLGDISGSIGSNPLMGSPTNVRTNITGKEKEAVGYFYAASCIHFEQTIKSLPRTE